MSVESKIIHLSERRNRMIVPALPPRRPFLSAARVAGGLLAFAALVFAAYVIYQAVRFDAPADPIVLGMLVVAGVYFLTGAVLVTRVYRRLIPARSRVADPGAGMKRKDGTGGKTAVILKFPEPATVIEPRPIWVRCRKCGSSFQAVNFDDHCPGCGRIAAA
jgi:hypothetical protein